VALGQVFSENFGFPCQSASPQSSSLSPEADTIDCSASSLTNQIIKKIIKLQHTIKSTVPSLIPFLPFLLNYSANPGDSLSSFKLARNLRYIVSGRIHRKHRLPSVVSLFSIVAETCLPSSCLAMNVSPGSTVPAFRHHITILSSHLCLGLLSCLLPSGFPIKSYIHSASPSCMLHALPISSSLLDHSNYTWRTVEVVKLLIMQSEFESR
jgi:hypothetical protein